MGINEENPYIKNIETINVPPVNQKEPEVPFVEKNDLTDINEPVVLELEMEEAYVIKDVTDKKKKKGFFFRMPFNTTILFTAMILFYELLFHGYYFGFWDINIVYIILFSLTTGGFISILTNLFPAIVNKILAVVFTLFTGILFIAQLIYHEVFNNYLSVAGTIKYGNQAADNYETVIQNVKENLWLFIMMLLPVLFIIIFSRRIVDYKPRKWWMNIGLAVVVVIIYSFNIMMMKTDKNTLYSAYQIYKQYTSVDMAVEKLGVYEAFIIDMREAVAGKIGRDGGDLGFQVVHTDDDTSDGAGNAVENTIETMVGSIIGIAGESADEKTADNETDECTAPIDTSPNVLEIDFDEINEEAGNEGISSLSDYFQSLEPTKKNEYTGMFEGYNLIFITAEGFSGYALESGLFPNLSKLADEGFVFHNYYQPLWYGSTLGGEYANLMGSPTKNGGYLSMYRAGKNENGMIFSLANQLNRKGYTSIGYHNNDYTYYDRDITHPALGYDWRANGSGLPEQHDEYGQVPWPQSDLIMVQDTVNEWINQQPFHVYYLTVSGHVLYSYDTNYISRKNWNIVSNLNYTEGTKAYLAAQYELEAAVTELLDELETHDLLDNTLIVLAGDHVPYDNMEILDELAGYELEDNFEAYKSRLIIWSASMEEPVEIDKVCSSIDILPTVSNLMGLDYDSRLMIGQDILADSKGLVMFANRSFITDDFFYDANTENIEVRDRAVISDGQVENMKAYVANKFTAADNITELNYYQYIEKYLSTNHK